MNRLAVVLTLIVAAAVGFAGTLVAYPRMAMTKASEGLLASGAPKNMFLHAPRVDETARRVVRPSPDLVYSACVYDLSDGPLRITAPRPANDRYASVSFYAANTDNFAVFNDRDPEFADGLYVVLTPPAEAGFPTPGSSAAADAIIESPSRTGIILLRRTVASDAVYPTIDAERRASTCGPAWRTPGG